MKQAIVIGCAALFGTACSLIPRPGAWQSLPSPPGVTTVVAAVSLTDGRVLVIGANRSTRIFDSRTNRWSEAPSLPVDLIGVTAVRLHDGRVLAVGPFTPPGAAGATQSRAFLYLPDANRWTPAAAPAMARQAPAIVVLADGRVLLIGGFDVDAQQPITTCELFDPLRQVWSRAASMDLARIQPAATLLRDGRVLVTGGNATPTDLFSSTFGFPNQSRPYTPLVYDPSRNRWSSHPYAVLVSNPVVVRLAGGLVMATAGFDGPRPSHVTQVFDPQHDSWTVRAGNPGGAGPDVTLADGRVALLGGLPYAYDAGADRWEPLTPVSGLVYAAFPLPDGRALTLTAPPFDAPQGLTGSAVFDPAGYPPLPGSTGPLASTQLIQILAAIAAGLAILSGVRLLITRWRS